MKNKSTKELKKEIERHLEFLKAVKIVKDETLTGTKEWNDAFAVCVAFLPPEEQARIKEESDAIFEEMFPGLKPHYYDEDGVAYYDGEVLRKGLGVSEEEFCKKAEALAESHIGRGLPAPCKPRNELHRVQ